VVEVMGRNRGFLALEVGLTAGAGIILVPEIKWSLQKICEITKGYEERGKATTIIVAAEGIGNTSSVAEYLEKNTPFEVRLSTLGYIQRGGSPTARSRLLANLFGAKAIEVFLSGAKNKMIGLKDNSLVSVDLDYACNTWKPLNKNLYKLAEKLAA
jgi:6-phosphofructokinase 1